MTAHATTDIQPTAQSGIAAAFAKAKASGRTALMPFITVGYPDLPTSEAIALALAEAGADLMEIGVPFSDPLADGTTIQRTSQVALNEGVTLADCFALVEHLRQRGVTIPLVLMGYANPFYQYGYERAAREAARVGADGFIVPDLPAEEADELLAACRKYGRDLIFLVAPTSTDERLKLIASKSSGFIYCVSLTGVTGARQNLSEGLPEYLGRVRAVTDLPLAVGFGISTAEHVRTVGQYAEGAIVASALINHIDRYSFDDQPRAAAEFLKGLRGE